MKHPETTLRAALEVAVAALKSYSTTQVGVHHAAIEQGEAALAAIPALPPIPHHDLGDAGDVAELRIVGKLVRDLLAAGYTLSVYDGEEITVEFSTNADTVFKALASTDSDILYANMGSQRSFVFLIWGNGVDVISDYSARLEEVLKPAFDLANELEG